MSDTISPLAPSNGARIVLTGVTGMVGEPLAKALAREHEVFGLARFTNPKARARLEAAGVQCVPFDLVDGDYDALPDDVDHVAHFAVSNTNDWDADLAANSEAVGLLMQRYASATSFLLCSSTAVYEPAGASPRAETSPLGDNHRSLMETYSIVKVATEAVARTMARAEDLPTTIARLNVPFGDRCGFPSFHLEMLKAGMPIEVNPDRPNLFNPIHTDDIARMVPRLLGVASVPATIVNWGGDEPVAAQEWCAYFGELTGKVPQVSTNPVPGTQRGVVLDVTKRRAITGPCRINWRDGMRAMFENRYPNGVDAGPVNARTAHAMQELQDAAET